MKNYCIISHTHWDREWYLSFEEFRIRLIDLIDRLIEILENDPEYRFHLDAQTIMLEDYLKIKPQNEDKLRFYIKNGRILVGPWYVQNDFHLTSGESTVRNLLIGTQIANDFGKCMNIGYAADQFGLCSQLPQILKRFGLDTCIFGRGFGRNSDSQFYWSSEDGSVILCEHMFAWYNNLQRLPSDAAASCRLIRERAEQCLTRGKGSSALLMNGVDHLEAQEDLTQILSSVSPMLSKNEKVFQDTMPEYMERLKKEIAKKNISLNTYSGEFRDQGQSNVLTGTLSSRVYLKQMNVKAQSALEKRFEPDHSILGIIKAEDYPVDHSKYLWKLLIENHPHDSICGCSKDAVHRHMTDRYERLQENLCELNDRCAYNYLSHIRRDFPDKNSTLILCANNSTMAFNGAFTVTLELLTEQDTGAFVIVDRAGKRIPFDILKTELNCPKRTLSPINLPGLKQVNRYTVALRPGNIGCMERKIFFCVPSEPLPEKRKTACANADVMENQYLKVCINANGSVNLTDKTTSQVFKNLLVIQDEQDNGNLYNYSLGDEKDRYYSLRCKAQISVICDTVSESKRRISYNMHVTRNGKSEYIPIEIILTLRYKAKLLEAEITVDNRLEDHRLRALIPTHIASDINYASQPFDIVYRNKKSIFKDDEMHPLTDFVGIDGDGYGIAVISEGLHEYQHIEDKSSTLALTLLRCTGTIGQYLGSEALTPEGQCKGVHTLRLGIYPYKNDHLSACVAQQAANFLSPPYAASQPYDHNTFIGGRPFVQASDIPQSFFRPIKNKNVIIPDSYSPFTMNETVKGGMVLSAFKKAENQKGYVLRFYNASQKKNTFTLKFTPKLASAALTDLSEKIQAPLTTDNNSLKLTAKPKEIVTLFIKTK